MIEFHAGTGPDTQAIGIALEEMFVDYRVMPGKAPLPVVMIGPARLVGPSNVLPALARRTGRFLPPGDFSKWFEAAVDMAALGAALEASDFICGDISIADMSVYPRLAAMPGAAEAEPAVARWMNRMWRRPGVGRGMTAMAG